MNLRLKWTDRYQGPNPLAAGPVLVAQLHSNTPPEGSQVKMALHDLWLCSGMERSNASLDAVEVPDDALLTLAKGAAEWAMAALNEVRGDIVHAGAVRAGTGIRLWVGFHHQEISRTALQLGLEAVVQRIGGVLDETRLQATLANLWQACLRHHPDYQARILRVGARAMDVPFLQFLPESRFWQFGWGHKSRVFMESGSNRDGALGWQWQKDKTTSKALMTALGLPAPAHALVMREADIASAVQKVGLPCVVKPLNLGGGRGVTANIQTIADACAAFQLARRLSDSQILVERHVRGDDHRLLVIEGTLVAVIRRQPSCVVGDGTQTVSDLLAELNASRCRNMPRSQYLRPIAQDEVLRRHLATQSLSLDDVPHVGQQVTLRSNANLSTGGTCTDVTDICHPQVRVMAEHLAKTSGLATIGVDYLTTDITQSPLQSGGAFIEMNTTPGLDACIAAGWPEALIAQKVLGTSVGRIPVELTVLDASGMQAVQGAMSSRPMRPGAAMVVGKVLHLDGLSLPVQSPEPWAAVSAALRHVAVTHLHVVCNADALMTAGIPVDRLDQTRVATSDGRPVVRPDWIIALEKQTSGKVELIPQQALIEQWPL